MPDAPSVGEFVDSLGVRAPFEKAAGWDPVGLQIGDTRAAARRVGICHEVTEQVAAAVEVEPVDLLVSYHPLLFHATRRLVAGRTPEGRALRLARAGVALAVVHTSFDVVPGGTADALALALGLEDVQAFAPLYGADTIKIATFVPAEAADALLDAVATAGAGRIGRYTHCSYRTEGVGSFFAGAGTSPVVGKGRALNREPEVRIEFPAPRAREESIIAALVAAHPYEEPAYDVYDRRGDAGLVGRIGSVPGAGTLESLARTVRTALAGPPLRVAGDPAQRIQRVAVVPGSGADFAALAAQGGADALVTGDLRHHTARDALDRGLCLLDPGHVATERPGLERLHGLVAEVASECVSFLDPGVDPWQAPCP